MKKKLDLLDLKESFKQAFEELKRMIVEEQTKLEKDTLGKTSLMYTEIVLVTNRSKL